MLRSGAAAPPSGCWTCQCSDPTRSPPRSCGKPCPRTDGFSAGLGWAATAQLAQTLARDSIPGGSLPRLARVGCNTCHVGTAGGWVAKPSSGAGAAREALAPRCQPRGGLGRLVQETSPLVLCQAVLVGKAPSTLSALGGTRWCLARRHRWAKLLPHHGGCPLVLCVPLGDRALPTGSAKDSCSQRWVFW